MRKRLSEWATNPRNGRWLCLCLVMAVWDLTDAIRYTVNGRGFLAFYEWGLFVAMVACSVFWARRLREQNGGVLWIPKVKLERQFPTNKSGPYVVWCGDQGVKVGPGPYWADAFRKPGDLDWERALKLATEEVVEKYRVKKLQQRENRKIKRRILKEARRGHRGNATNDPSGAAEGADGEPGGQSPAAGSTNLAFAGGSFTLSGVASSGLSNLITGVTHLEFNTEPLDIRTVAEPDEELDTYTIPVWGFRSWNLLGGGVPKLGSLNSGRHVWTPGVNVAVCQAADYEMRSSSGSVAFSIRSSGNWKVHVPGDNCTCGFYAVRDVFDVQPGIIGGVVGWGKVVDGEKGWRSEKAAVAALYRAPWASVEEQQKVEMLAELYNVPVCLTLIDLADKTRELAEWMAGDDLLTGDVDG